MNLNNKFSKWLKEQDVIMLAKQKASSYRVMNNDQPYYGAIGGAWSNMIRIDQEGNRRHYTKHATGNTFDWPSQPIHEYTQKYLDQIYVEGHEYEISECNTSIGSLVNIKDLTIGCYFSGH